MRMIPVNLLLAVAVKPSQAFAATSFPHVRRVSLQRPSSPLPLRAPRPRPLPVHALPSVGSVALRLTGGSAAPLASLVPTGFNAVFLGLLASVALLRTSTAEKKTEDSAPVDPGALSLQRRFLAVFWLFRLADWLQGPYFVEVYTSKVLAEGAVMGMDTIAKLFLTGFGTTALLGPFVGKWVDKYGRKKGSIAYAAFYTWAALAVRSSSLPLLFLGRVMGGIGTSLLFSAPEAWLVGEHQRQGFPGAALGATFGLAYFGDSLMAMGAGQLAQVAASARGPASPFTLSTAFLGLGALLTAVLWSENTASGGAAPSPALAPAPAAETAAEAASAEVNMPEEDEGSGGGSGDGVVVGGGDKKLESSSSKQKEGGGAIKRAFSAMVADPRIMLVGSIQAFFEGSMYIFVLQWPRALRAVMTQAAAGASVPYGKIFSCFMACCMLGSSVYPALARRGVACEDSTCGMLGLALAAMATSAAVGHTGLSVLAAAFFAFEACVGFYFPSIGTLRSKYLPDEHRSITMNLFAVPLNLIVVAVYLQIARLGTTGALWCSASSLGLSFLASLALRRKAATTIRNEEAPAIAP